MNVIRMVYAVMAVTVFFGNVPNWLHFQYGVGVPWYWVVALIVLSLPLLFLAVVTSNIVRQPLVVWCYGYLCLTMIWFIVGPQTEMAWQEVRWRVLAIMEVLSFLAIFMDAQANQFARRTVVAAVHVGVAVNIYELFVPMSFSNVFGRSAGLYLSPNLAGEALVLGMIVGITVVPAWYRGLFVLLTGVGVFVTYSRGGLIGWCLAVGGLLLGRFVNTRQVAQAGLAALLLVGLLIVPKLNDILATLERAGAFNADALERLAWLTDPSGVSDTSSWSRIYVAQQAWQRLAEHPFWGEGTGAVHEGLDIPPHNQFLAYMIDHGVLGALLLPWLLLALLWPARADRRRIGVIFSVTVLWFSFFTHTLLNNPYSLLLFALMAAFAPAGRRPVRPMSQAIHPALIPGQSVLARARS
ncbi:O-antigen ligase family protein [Nitrospira moscoviensis]|nr:O-antigen ligase family protein [Nitrospira moscoviensis]